MSIVEPPAVSMVEPSGKEQGDATRKDACAGQSDQKRALPAKRNPRGQAQGVEHRRGDHHAREKAKAVRLKRHLGPVGRPMKESGERHQTDAEAQGHPDRAGEQQAQDEDGGKNPPVHAVRGVARDAYSRAGGHGPDERRREGPAGAIAQLRRPHAYRQHGEDMVPAREGMKESGRQVGRAVAGMGLRERRACQQKDGKQPRGEFGFHGVFNVKQVVFQLPANNGRPISTHRTTMEPALLVLAAGLGSRYGGLKQLEPVGPSGETLLDYAVFDALRAGFAKVVFVIRRDTEGLFRERIGSRYAGRVAVDYAFQELGALPEGFAPQAGRTRPWGTGHALWCARGAMAGGFAAINADDFYGADAFVRLAAFLDGQGEPTAGVQRTALAGFRLADTLSEHGPVSRGVCRIEGGRLCSIDERTAIARADVGYGRLFSGEEIVSMNCWAFGPGIFPLITAQLAQFLEIHEAELKAEFYLPEALSRLVARGEVHVEVLNARGPWFGVTYREDRPRVAAALAALVRKGDYPERLF